MVLSRYLDAIMIRTFSQADIDELAEFADVPVINGLSDDHHPCQALADLLTLRERFGPDLAGVRLAYVGDANNVCRSLVCAAVIAGIDVVVAAPDAYQLDEPTVAFAAAVTAAGGGSLTLTDDADEAARGAQALATDAFISMGQEVETAERLRALMPGYRVDERRVVAARRRRRRAALPARALRPGDRRVGALRPALGGLGSGREPPARAEGPARRAARRLRLTSRARGLTLRASAGELDAALGAPAPRAVATPGARRPSRARRWRCARRGRARR